MSSEFRPIKKRRRVLRYLFILVLFGAVGYAIYLDATRPLPVQTTTAKVGRIKAYVEERARTTVPRIYHVTMPMEGRILPLTVREGDSVTKGQIVANLDETDLKEAEISADELLVAMKNSVDAALANVEASKARADFTSWVHDKLKKAAETSGASEKEAREAEWQDLDAKVKQEESLANRFTTEAFYAIAKLLPDIVERNLKRAEIKSPVDGVILRRYVSNEKTMASGSAILDIANLEQLQVTADILTDQAIRVIENQKVEIFGEAIGDEPITGRVRRVRPEAFTKISSLGVEQQRVAVEIAFNASAMEALNAAGRKLGLNYRVRVRIITAEKKGVTVVPRTALFRGDAGEWQVFRIDENNRTERADVTVGLTNDYEAEIETGLESGDRIVLAPDAALEAGTLVEFEK